MLARTAGAMGFDVEAAFVVLEFVANIVLFTPFPLAVAVMAPAWPPVALAMTGIGASILVEVVQFAVPGRVPTLSDVLANSLGTLAGIAILGAVRRVREPISASDR
ncbi:VanZ family protein [Agromyces seonyuensis]|uniref:VanZ-like domain-containing protein n=1 Tax=Agromyces seonyuensis TaxID=2662446 RepID=A0A6I4P1W7_9MICO|nr:VanZ family protein [Agromyces seonyuensis]MWB98735.1 hypothetical protein [Agromyces seonyuensis]